MTIDAKVARHQLYLADTTLSFAVDLAPGDLPATWTTELVIRDLESACLDPRNDGGTGTLLITLPGVWNATTEVFEVALVRDDLIAAGIQAADYIAGFNRTDVERPLRIMRPLHFTSWPQGD